MRRQALLIMITPGLAEVVIADTVEEDHQHGPGHKKQDHSRERIHYHTDPKHTVPGRQPGYRMFKGILAEMFYAQRADEHDHAAQPGEEGCGDRDRMAQRLAPV